jgi:two-component system response regulator FixJ
MQITASNRHVLIVDDDPAMRDALAVVFRLAGYRVSLFPDAESFLTAAPMKPPAALIVDVHLPGLSGLDLLERLDAESYGAPIVMISADADVAHVVEAIKRGACDYMVKPLDGRRLVARIGGAIASFERHQSAARFPGQTALTPREHEVLDAIAGGASNKEVGRRLGISPRPHHRRLGAHRAAWSGWRPQWSRQPHAEHGGVNSAIARGCSRG